MIIWRFILSPIELSIKYLQTRFLSIVFWTGAEILRIYFNGDYFVLSVVILAPTRCALPPLKLKDHDSLADALADLGEPEEIKDVLTGFQKYLYRQAVA